MPFVRQMIVETSEVADPTWEMVEKAIRSLDANTTTLVILQPMTADPNHGSDEHMGLGGCSDQLIVYVTSNNLEFWNLRNSLKAGDNTKVLINVGGQEGDYRTEQLVSTDDAVRAAHAYFENGKRADVAGHVWLAS